MDGTRFDSLTRSLTDARSRRGVLSSLLVGTLGLVGWFDSQEAAAKNCKQIKDKKKRKKCLKKGQGAPSQALDASPSGDPAPPPPPPPPGPCIPACAGKVCGADGCGGSCGIACTGGKICPNGVCVCPSGTEECGGGCVPLCAATEMRTAACGCCRLTGQSCGADGCCSGICKEQLGPDVCIDCLPAGAICEGVGPCCPPYACDGVSERCQEF